MEGAWARRGNDKRGTMNDGTNAGGKRLRTNRSHSSWSQVRTRCNLIIAVGDRGLEVEEVSSRRAAASPSLTFRSPMQKTAVERIPCMGHNTIIIGRL